MKRNRNPVTVAALALALLPATAAFADEGDIGYPTVAAARAALAARDDVRMSRADGWLTIEDPAAMTLWTFAPDGDPAHPAAVKRSVIEDGERIIIRMDIRCEGALEACDALEQHFLGLNRSVSENALQAAPGTGADADEPDDE